MKTLFAKEIMEDVEVQTTFKKQQIQIKNQIYQKMTL